MKLTPEFTESILDLTLITDLVAMLKSLLIELVGKVRAEADRVTVDVDSSIS